jgi:WhiB family redox-sensing transcriptional regulator
MNEHLPCTKVDPEIFFPESFDKKGIALAKSICDTCNVVAECIASVLWDPKIDGIWGGTTPRQRETMRTNLRKLGKGKTKV